MLDNAAGNHGLPERYWRRGQRADVQQPGDDSDDRRIYAIVSTVVAVLLVLLISKV